MGINDYLKVVRRRWPVVVVAGLLGLLIGYLVTPGAANQASEQGSYSATATVLQAPDVKESVASTALLVTSDAVVKRVSTALNTQAAPQELLLQVAAVSDKTSNAIAITASDTEPLAAVALANAFAKATVDEFLARHRDTAATRFKNLEGQRTEVDNQLRQIAGQLGGAVSGPVNPVLQSRASVLSARYAEIYGLLQEAANQANNPTGLETLTPAARATSNAGALSLSSSTARTVVGLALGLLLGGALALALEHFDTRPKDRAAVQRAYRLPVLAEIPKVRHSERRNFAVITASQPESSAAEAYRSLRSSIMFANRIHHFDRQDMVPDRSAVDTTQPRQVILVASARAAEGKTATVVNLAACFADVGKRVLVLDCDFRGPDAHQYLGVRPGTGLSNLLTSTATVDLSLHVRPSDIPRVDVIPAGTQLERPSTLPARMGDVVTQARELADIVLIDSAPLLLANDAMDLMPYIDTILVVSYAGRATLEQAQRASELLARTRAPIIGIALVGVKGRSYRDLMSYSSGEREDLIAMDVLQRPSPQMTVPTPVNNGAQQKRES